MRPTIKVLAAICLLTSCAVMTYGYEPRYWLFGEGNASMVDAAHQAGWGGITYWGADRRGSKMIYYFTSPYLAKQEWAVSGGDKLSALVEAAHAKGMKVAINIEDVNPYHWKQHHWTPEAIRAVAADMAATGVDAVFEECFEVRPDLFLALTRELKQKGVAHISGADGMVERQRNYTELWPETGVVQVYNYYLKRDRDQDVSVLAQHATLGYGWAKWWGMPTAMLSPLEVDWGIATADAPAVVRYMCMIRALQFRVDNFFIYGKMSLFNRTEVQKWIAPYVDKQERPRPLLNVVVLLAKSSDPDTTEDWTCLLHSGDAITSGAFHGGYDLIVSDKPVAADAYWIYADGAKDLTEPVVALFDTDKPVFLQSYGKIPSSDSATARWRLVLNRCGIDAAAPFAYSDLPRDGKYDGQDFRFTGRDELWGKEKTKGTIIPRRAVSGTVRASGSNVPFILGQNRKYVVTASCIGWQTSCAVSHVLAGCGTTPASNVWGIAGKNVSAFLAVADTELNLSIPGLADGAQVHVVVWDRRGKMKYEAVQRYSAPYKQSLAEYDLILIDTETSSDRP